VKLTDRIYLVGSGSLGLGLSDPYDCHVYLLDGGEELALVDVGAGMGAEQILENVRRDGHDPAAIRHLVLTHAHGDHAGGAARMCSLLDGPTVHLSAATADFLRRGDERGVSIDVAKRAGTYPRDYRYEPCRVDNELREGDQISIGEVMLQVYDTPGHCDGHVSLLLEVDEQRALFAGDAVFFGGRILLQNIYDCRLDCQIDSLRKLRDLEITALLPGHAVMTLSEGQSHIERANQVLDRLLIPQQLFDP
jgi:hydroxyacylglutathione hydrolase